VGRLKSGSLEVSDLNARGDSYVIWK
jgi:hypothetical protein